VGELEAFASDVAHEVRNPLAAIRSAADLLPASTSEEERGRLLVLIGAEVRRVDEVVSALQELARIDAGARTDGATSADLATLVESVAGAFRERDDGAHRIVVIHPYHAAIAVPPEAAARVVENLLQNALSFSPAGGAVRLTVTQHPDGAELVVADDGPGVPAEHHERVFERFFSWRPAGGTGRHLGLGLAVARALAEHHGGSIRLDAPVEGGGAAFRVRWPGARL
jgi:two-component system sensor histidine kinase ChvG